MDRDKHVSTVTGSPSEGILSVHAITFMASSGVQSFITLSLRLCDHKSSSQLCLNLIEDYVLSTSSPRATIDDDDHVKSQDEESMYD